MSIAVWVICILSFLWWAELAIEWWLFARKGLDLADISMPPTEISLSVIVPARNEEKNIVSALPRLLQALPEGAEVIFVNDRSTDETGPVARRMAQDDSRLKVIDISGIPDDWLGKNHAMQTGYQASGGDYLLFTDADVVFEPGCLSKAIGYCHEGGIDHLVATPRMVTKGFWERVFVSFFSILLVSRFRIWRAAIPRSRFYAGIGAFNLVSRTAYECAGTHRAIRTEVVDDLILGKLVKRSGGIQRVVGGERCLSVRWNEGLGGLVKGLEKNAFAGFNYRFTAAAGGCFAVLTGILVPVLLPLAYVDMPLRGTDLIALAYSLCIWTTFLVLYALASKGTGVGWHYFLTIPAGAVILVWAIARSVFLYHLRGGVKWRGTVYRKSGLP